MGDKVLAALTTMRREQLAYIAFCFIIPFAGFVSHTVVPLPPTVVFLVVGSFFLIIFSFATGKVLNVTVTALPIVFVLYVAVSQTMIDAPVTHYFGVALWGGYLQPHQREKLVERFVVLSVIFLTAEVAYRIMYPDPDYAIYPWGHPLWIYKYKLKGLMYTDSNGTAIHIVVLLFYLVARELKGVGNYRWLKVILIVLLVLTFSRAAWIGAFMGWVYIKLFYERSPITIFHNLMIFFIIALIGYFFVLQPLIADDASFRSKFMIAGKVMHHLMNASPQEILFGIGFSRSLDVLNDYAHNFLMVFLVESGIIGMLMMVAIFCHFILITRKRASVIIVPFIFTTLSSTLTFIPFFYLIIGLLYLDEQDYQESL
jgi:hypothetical protein